MASFERITPDSARGIITKLLPDATARRLVLELIVECIRENAHKPETWGVTLHANEVGLNIGGGFYCVWIRQNQVALFYLPVPESNGLSYDTPFTTYPDVRRTHIPEAEIAEWLPLLRPGVLDFVRKAVAKYDRMNAGIQRAHSPGVLRFIENELGVTVPDPVYSSSQSPARTPRYWAGGHHWSTGSKLHEFIPANAWWHGFSPDDMREKAAQTRALFAQISVGDYFAIKGYGGQNDLKIHYVGRVKEVDSDTQRITLEPLPLPNPVAINPAKETGSWFGTLREVTNPAIISWMFNQQPYQPVTTPDTIPESYPLNVILYGPPGTGKTYNSIVHAVEIIDGVRPGDIGRAKARWDELRDEGRIEFVTFHQSYGYEDFVEGIRPVMDDEAGDMPRYEIHNGILKRMALTALHRALEIIPHDTGEPTIATFDQVWNALLEEVVADPTTTYPGDTDKTEFQFTMTNQGTLHMRNILNPDTRVQTLGRELANEIWDAWAQGDESRVDYLLRKGHYPARRIAFEKLKRLAVHEDTPPAGIVEEQDLSLNAAQDYLRFTTHSEYQMKDEAQRFVLVIDEINRGNISKVFGELITLIEDDKRIGAELALTVTLPYSREKFGLPRNLYLLGTMNTADKSIALVDVALRRRFEFKELMPDFSTCKGLDAEMRLVLEKLNRRIVLRKDRDHQIGHAFFVRVTNRDEFNRAFEKRVIPLLQEYFYGDWDAVRFVLGEEDGRPQRFIVEIPEAQGLRGARNRWQWYRDVGQPLNILDALKQNYGISAVPLIDVSDNGQAMSASL